MYTFISLPFPYPFTTEQRSSHCHHIVPAIKSKILQSTFPEELIISLFVKNTSSCIPHQSIKVDFWSLPMITCLGASKTMPKKEKREEGRGVEFILLEHENENSIIILNHFLELLSSVLQDLCPVENHSNYGNKTTCSVTSLIHFSISILSQDI